MTVIKVEDMHCEKCVERINQLFTKEEISFEVSLNNKTVTLQEGDEKLELALEALEDLGFTAKVDKSF